MTNVHPVRFAPSRTESRRCQRFGAHPAHQWVADPADGRDYFCAGAPAPGRQVPTEPRPRMLYVLEEREAGIARARRHVLAGRPVLALAALIATVQAQARIEGIGGVSVPYRPSRVERPRRRVWEMRRIGVDQ